MRDTVTETSFASKTSSTSLSLSSDGTSNTGSVYSANASEPPTLSPTLAATATVMLTFTLTPSNSSALNSESSSLSRTSSQSLSQTKTSSISPPAQTPTSSRLLSTSVNSTSFTSSKVASDSLEVSVTTTLSPTGSHSVSKTIDAGSVTSSSTDTISSSSSHTIASCNFTSSDVLDSSTALVFQVSGFAGGPENATYSIGIDEVVPMSAVLAAIDGNISVFLFVKPDFWFSPQAENSTSAFGSVVGVDVTQGSGISVVISVADVETSHITVSRIIVLEVHTDVLIVARGLPCAKSSVTLVYRCIVLPLRKPVLFQSALQATFQATTTASGMLGNPVSAMTTTGMVSILTLDECIFSDVDSLDPQVSPLGFSIGTEPLGRYYRGAVVSAVVVYSTFAAAIIVVSTVAPKLNRDLTTAELFALLRFPSNLLIPIALFHQGMVTCATSLIRVGTVKSSDMVLGIFGLLTSMTLTAFVWLAGTRWRKCHQVLRSDNSAAKSDSKVLKAFITLSLWKFHWVDDDDNARNSSWPQFKRRYLLILDDMATPWWTSLEMSSGVVQGVILGVRRNDLKACQAQRAALVVHCVAMFAAAVVVQPCGSFFGNFFLVSSKLGSLIVSLLILIHTESGNANASAAAQLTTIAFTFVSSIQTVIQLLLALALARDALLSGARSLLEKRKLLAMEASDRKQLATAIGGGVTDLRLQTRNGGLRDLLDFDDDEELEIVLPEPGENKTTSDDDVFARKDIEAELELLHFPREVEPLQEGDDSFPLPLLMQATRVTQLNSETDDDDDLFATSLDDRRLQELQRNAREVQLALQLNL